MFEEGKRSEGDGWDGELIKNAGEGKVVGGRWGRLRLVWKGGRLDRGWIVSPESVEYLIGFSPSRSTTALSIHPQRLTLRSLSDSFKSTQPTVRHLPSILYIHALLRRSGRPPVPPQPPGRSPVRRSVRLLPSCLCPQRIIATCPPEPAVRRPRTKLIIVLIPAADHLYQSKNVDLISHGL